MQTANAQPLVVVLGSANMDLVVRQKTFTGPGETVFGESFTTVPGGKGLNQAVAAARMGARVEFAGCIGTDAFGDQLHDLLVAEGIGVAGLERSEVPTGTAHITVVDSGENSITVVSGANMALTALTPVQAELLASAQFLVMQFELAAPLIAEAAAFAHENGVTVILTPAPVAELRPELLQRLDYLVPNEHEALQLAEADEIEDAASTLSAHGTTVIATLGAAGALVASGGEIVRRFRAKRVTAVDTTGAGDTFVGALVSELARGATLPAAVELAIEASAISVTRSGATSSMPLLAEVRAD